MAQVAAALKVRGKMPESPWHNKVEQRQRKVEELSTALTRERTELRRFNSNWHWSGRSGRRN